MRTSILLPAPWSIIRDQQKLLMQQRQQLLHLHNKVALKMGSGPFNPFDTRISISRISRTLVFSLQKKQASLPTTYTTHKSINTNAQLHMRTLLQQSRRHDS
jgi:hypothetical protein